ncbi:hypothetical protein BC829DRAFT_380335 [Chytridium lagenaria]|nr:hypothetical protein BC829DRAFT_380335 [Chytridium lagenaria]
MNAHARSSSLSPPIDIPTALSPTAAAAFASMQSRVSAAAVNRMPQNINNNVSVNGGIDCAYFAGAGPLDMTLLPAPASTSEQDMVLSNNNNNNYNSQTAPPKLCMDEGYGSSEIPSPLAAAVVSGFSTMSPSSSPLKYEFDHMAEEDAEHNRRRSILLSTNSLLAVMDESFYENESGLAFDPFGASPTSGQRRGSIASTVGSFASSSAASVALPLNMPSFDATYGGGFNTSGPVYDIFSNTGSVITRPRASILSCASSNGSYRIEMDDPTAAAVASMTPNNDFASMDLSMIDVDFGHSSQPDIFDDHQYHFGVGLTGSGDDMVHFGDLSLLSPPSKSLPFFEHDTISSSNFFPLPYPHLSLDRLPLILFPPSNIGMSSPTASSSTSFGSVGCFAGGPFASHHQTLFRSQNHPPTRFHHQRRSSDSFTLDPLPIPSPAPAPTTSPTSLSPSSSTSSTSSSNFIVPSHPLPSTSPHPSRSSPTPSDSTASSRSPSPPPTKGLFHCACTKTFSSLGSLRQHAKNHHSNRTKDFACSVCGKRF